MGSGTGAEDFEAKEDNFQFSVTNQPMDFYIYKIYVNFFLLSKDLFKGHRMIYTYF